jgi:subtilisin family serine protease
VAAKKKKASGSSAVAPSSRESSFDDRGVRFIKRGGKIFLQRKREDGIREYPAAGDDDPIYVLPPVIIDPDIPILPQSETVDWGVKLTGIPALWLHSRGEGCKVAVLDTGIDMAHPDLEGSILDAADFTNSKSGPQDLNGHGTHCCGVIAARQNLFGVVGVAHKAGILSGKVLGDNGSGSSSGIARGVRWAIDKGANIISMSLGSSQASEDSYRAIKEATAKGIVVICAAGNEGPRMGTVGYPGRYPEVICVGAFDSNKKVTSFSSRGPEVDICAPGANILSTTPGRTYRRMSGTSMATPFCAGVVALMWSKHNQFNGDLQLTNAGRVLTHLKKTAVDVGRPGHDTDYGFGLVNPEALLRAMGIQDGPILTLSTSMFTPNALAEIQKTFPAGSRYEGQIDVDGRSVRTILDMVGGPGGTQPAPGSPFDNPFDD